MESPAQWRLNDATGWFMHSWSVAANALSIQSKRIGQSHFSLPHACTYAQSRSGERFSESLETTLLMHKITKKAHAAVGKKPNGKCKMKSLPLKSQQQKSIAKMWGKGVFTTASFLYFSAICCLLPGCFAADPVPASTQPSIAANVTSSSSPSALPKTFKWTSTGPLAQPTVRVGLAQGLQLRRLQQSVHRLHVEGQHRGQLRRGHDDLHQLVSDGHRHPVLAPRRGRCADPDLFHPEEDLGSHVRVGPVAFQLT